VPSRKVAVELELETARYNRGAAEAAAVTRGVKAAIDDLGDEADKTSVDMVELATNTDLAKHAVDDLGDEAVGTAAQLGLLETATRRVLSNAAGGGGGRRRGFRNFDFSNTWSEMRGQLLFGLVGLIAVASPAIGAMIAGAITTAIGSVAIGGAIASAIKNANVRAAASEFGSSISSMFFSLGNKFTTVMPIITALKVLKDGFRDLNLARTFEIVAPYIELFAKSLAAAGRAFMSQFNPALEAARPTLTMFAKDLPSVLYYLGQMFRTMAESKGTVIGLHLLMKLLAGTFLFIGNSVAWLAERLVDLMQIQAKLYGALEDIPGLAQATGVDFANLNDIFERFIAEAEQGILTAANMTRQLLDQADATQTTGEAMSELIGLSDDLYDHQRNLITATINYEQALDDLRDALRENGATLDLTTQQGRDNASVLLQGIEAAKARREERIRDGQSIGVANILYQQEIDLLVTQAAKYGLNRQKVEEFIAALRKVPEFTKAQIVLELELHGIKPGEHSGAFIDQNPDFVPTFPPVPIPVAHGARAGGGPLSAYGAYLVGETRPEVIQMGSMGGYAYPSVDSWAGTGASAPEVHVYIGDEELRGIVRVEVRERDRHTRRRVMAGVG